MKREVWLWIAWVVLVFVAVLWAAHEVRAHEWLEGKTSPRWNSECCNDQDCEPIPPTSVRFVGDGYMVKHPDIETAIHVPLNEVQESGDRQWWACVFPPVLEKMRQTYLRCFFRPPTDG